MLPEPDQAKVRIGIRWHTGATDVLIADRPAASRPGQRTPVPGMEIVRRLGPTTDTATWSTGSTPPGGHRPRQAIRHRRRPVDPSRLQDPGTQPLHTRRTQRCRGRRPAGLQHRRHLLLAQDRATRCPPRRRQPAVHPLDRRHRGRLPCPPGRIRAPQPRSPAHQAPATTLRRPKCQCSLPCSRQRTRECGPDQHTSPPHQNIPTRGCRKGSMNRPSRPLPTGWSRRPSSWCSNPSSRRTSSRARTGSARTAARTTRSPRSTTWRPGPATITGSWRPTSGPASTKSGMSPSWTGSGQDQGQASLRAGQGVPQSRDHDGRRRWGREPHRHPAGRDTVPAAGQHRAVGAG